MDALLTEAPDSRQDLGLTLTLVCKIFKGTIARSNVFWSFLIIDPGFVLTAKRNVISQMKTLDDVLRRTRRYPLDFFAIFPLHEQTSSDCSITENVSGERHRWEAYCRVYLDRLVAEQHRWKNALIHTGHSCESSPSLMCPAAIYSAVNHVPILENFSICAISHDCLSHKNVVFQGLRAPSLRTLELDAVPRHSARASAELESVSIPILRELVAGDGVPLSFLSQSLVSCAETVDTLRWQHGWPYLAQDVPPSVRLPSLKNLILQDPVLKTLGMIETPNIEVLTVRSTFDFTFQFVRSLHAVSAILSLDLGGARVSSTDLQMLIEGLPKLHDLRCRTHSRDSREVCFDKLRQVIDNRKGGMNPFRHFCCHGVGGMAKGELLAWNSLRKLAKWQKVDGNLYQACFVYCVHDGGNLIFGE